MLARAARRCAGRQRGFAGSVVIRNFRAHWLGKLVGLAVFLSLFFRLYFQLARHPQFPVHVMPRLGLDTAIGIHAAALPLYLSLWFYIVLAVGLIATRRGLAQFLGGSTLLAGAGCAAFYFLPTAVEPSPLALHTRGWRWLATVDAAGNACPSLHVAFVVYAAAWLRFHLRGPGLGGARFVVLAWGFGIVVSTVATGQHVTWDVLGGALLGAGGVAVLPPVEGPGGPPTRPAAARPGAPGRPGASRSPR